MIQYLFNQASENETAKKIAEEKIKDKIVDEVFEKIGSDKLDALRSIYGRATGAADRAEQIGNTGHKLLEATLNNGLRDIEFYRTINTTPTGRHYYTDRVVPWGRVDWRRFDSGGSPLDAMGNILNHGAGK